MAPTKPPAPPSPTNATMVYQSRTEVSQLCAQRDEGFDVMRLMNEARSRRIVSGIHGRRLYDVTECQGLASGRSEFVQSSSSAAPPCLLTGIQCGRCELNCFIWVPPAPCCHHIARVTMDGRYSHARQLVWLCQRKEAGARHSRCSAAALPQGARSDSVFVAHAAALCRPTVSARVHDVCT